MPLSGTLKFYLKMDESGTGSRADSTANALDFTNNNSADDGTGKVNNGTVFVRSSSQSLSRADETDLRCTGDWHVSFWVKIDTLTNYNVLWNKGSGGSEAWIYTQANGSLVLEVGNYYAYNSAAKAAGSLTTGVWYHICAWRNSSTGEIGLTLNNDTPATGTNATAINGSSTGMYIGSSNGGNYCDATIDEFAFGQFVPTANDRKLYYGTGSPGSYEELIAEFPTGCTAYYALEDETDSAGSNDLTNQNTTTFVAGALDNCANFDSASSQKLSCASDAALQDADEWSVSFWYRSANQNGGDGAWCGKGVYSSPGYEWAVRPVDNSSVWIYISSTGTDFPYGQFNLGSSYLNDSTWHHCVVRYKGSGSANADRLRVWSDGVEKTGSYSGTIPSTMFTSTGDFIMGGMFSNILGYSKIRIDEFAFFAGKALTGTDVAALYNSGTPLAYVSSGPTTHTGDITEGAKSGDTFAVLVLFKASFTEGSKSGDTVTPLVTFRSSVSEGAKSGDSETVVARFRPTLTEGVKSGDSETVLSTFKPSITEGAKSGDTDTVVATFRSTLTEGSKSGDTNTFSLTLRATITEGSKSGETNSVRAVFGGATTEGGVSSDSTVVVGRFRPSVTEGAKSSDTVNTVARFSTSLTDGAKSGETVTARATYYLEFGEGAKSGDTVIAPTTFAVSFSEGAKSGDTVVTQLRISTAITEGAKSGDSSSVRYTGYASVSEGTKAGDSESARLTISVSITESAVSSDTHSAICTYMLELIEGALSGDSYVSPFTIRRPTPSRWTQKPLNLSITSVDIATKLPKKIKPDRKDIIPPTRLDDDRV